VLVWPGLALAVVCAAYCGLGPAVFRKDGGRVSLFARVLLAPYTLGQRLSLAYYARQCRPWDEVSHGVWMGRKLTDKEAAEATRLGVTAVLDLTSEFSEARPFVSLAYRNIPVLDLTAPTLDQLAAATVFIREHAAQGTVYVHCKIGYSRSAAVVGAFLLESGICHSVNEAIARMRAARPPIIVRPEALAALRGVAERGANAEVSIGTAHKVIA
jgi:protein-tyrosine phosphatase